MKKLILSILLLIGFATQGHAIVTSTINKNILSCNGSSTTFQYTFPIIDTTNATDLQVSQFDNLGNQTILTTNYSVNTTTGTVTYPVSGAACPSGYTIVLLRVEPLTQGVAASYQGPGPTPPVMNMSDKLTMISQQLSEAVGRSIQAPLTSTQSIVFPSAVPGYLLGWNSSNALANINNPSAVAQWSLSGLNISYNLGNVSTTQNFTAGSLNWTNIQLIQGYNINWPSVVALVNSSAMNWSSVNSLATINYGGINWSSTNIFPTSAAGNVGVGSSNPGATLDVKGTIRSTNFISTGNVGIGSTSPGQALDVQGTIRASGFIGTASSSTGLSFGTAYGPAAQDGMLFGSCAADSGGSGGQINCITDNNSSPSTIITEANNDAQNLSLNCSAFVNKGNYYKVNQTTCTQLQKEGFYPL